jgi:hypothetical protein
VSLEPDRKARWDSWYPALRLVTEPRAIQFKYWIEEKRSLGFAHRFRPTYPDFLHGAPPTPACAAFIEESRMKLTNARKLDRKSGVRFGERGAPVDCLRRC